jgi:hypothetical protein
MLTLYTPRPWKAERGTAGTEHPLFVTAPGKDGIRPWCDADAHLMAAAPDLLDALTLVLDSLGALTKRHELDGWLSAAEQKTVWEAIDKANGYHPVLVKRGEE